MADNEITVRITADASELNAGAQEAAGSVEQMGEQMGGAAEHSERFEKSLVHMTAHITGHAIPGMGRMAVMMARMGESAIGVAPILATLIPLAALVGGYEIMSKLEEAALKIKEADNAWAAEGGKLNDELLKEQETLTGLTKGPLAEALEKTKDFAKEENNLSEILKQADTNFEAHVHWYSDIAAKAEAATAAVQKFLYFGAEGFNKPKGEILDKATFHSALEDLIRADQTVGQLKNSLTGLAELRGKVILGGGPEMDAQLIAIQNAFERITEQMKVNNLKQEVLGQEATKEAKKEQEKKQEVMVKGWEEEVRLQKLRQELNAKALEMTKKDASEFTKELEEQSKKAKEIEDREFEESVAANDRKFTMEEAAIQKNLALRLEKEKMKGGGGSRAEQGSYAEASASLEKLMADEYRQLSLLQMIRDADLKAGDTEGATKDQTAIDRLQDRLDKQLDMEQQYAIKVETLQDQIKEKQQTALLGMTSSLQSNLMQWMEGHERFGRAMMHTWMSIAQAAVQSMLKQEAQAIIGAALHSTLARKEQMENMGPAMAGAYKAIVGIPYVGPFLAPAFAAAAGVAIGSFAEGGISEGGASILHKNEMVLPPHISTWVQQAAKMDPAGGANGGGDHFHYAPNISAIDRNGVEDMLRDHSDLMFTQFQSELRRRNHI